MGNPLRAPVVAWYAEHARDLPWRRPETSPWGVLVSEFMLQQTPVARVIPVYDAWLATWPTPSSLAAAPSGEAVRAWGRLGYPRRALRLHAAAVAITEEHDGVVPSAYEDLRRLAGVGDYTAAAVASFAYGGAHAVLDTNVRRVLARAVQGKEFPATSTNRHEKALAESLVPDDDPALWAVAVMELGALVCTATNPRCGDCPISDQCAWLAAGKPEHEGPPRPVQAYAGTDRQVRGLLLAVLRGTEEAVHRSRLDAVWHDEDQRERALTGLIADGLVVRVSGSTYALPG